MANEKILKTIKELKEKSKKRNFSQSFDLIVNLKEMDMKKPENKMNVEAPLPFGIESKVGVFSDSHKDLNADIFTTADVANFGKNKREAKKLARDTDFFLAEPKMMALVGKTLGQMLGPRGKVPKVLTGNPKELIDGYKKSVRIRTKETPVVQCFVGKETMKDEEVSDNIEAVLKFLEGKLPKGKINIGNVMLKLTMSKPVKLEV